MKEMSLRRFGVPEDALDYLAEFDRDNRNLVLTAFGPGEPFEALMGAYAQGDDFSPLGWVCTMDWKLAPCAMCPRAGRQYKAPLNTSLLPWHRKKSAI